MSEEPTTEAGKRLLAEMPREVPWFIGGSEAAERAYVAAIEAEAREGYVRADVAAVKMALAQAEARADLARRIEERVGALGWRGEAGLWRDILAIMKDEAER